jgi:phosphatidylglycerol---prolipoprotein diacylglyceryl transferase
MIPYFEQPSLSLGPLTIHAFGVMVASAIIFGHWIATRRAQAQGLNPDLTERMIWYALIFGFVGAHLYSAIAYFPERIVENPLYLLMIWDGISSFGGMIGGLIGMAVFFKWRSGGMAPGDRWRYIDTVAYGFPFAWIFGRLGCSLAHDHPGTVTNFFLGISLESDAARDYITAMYVSAGRAADLPSSQALSGMAFHDLGFYEFLYTLLIMAPVTYLMGRKPRPGGFFLALFLLLYTPVRFFLDFLRLVDVTYAGLTPGQWAVIPVFGLALYIVQRQLLGRGVDDADENQGRRPKKKASAK